jgi:hypothetical protein
VLAYTLIHGSSREYQKAKYILNYFESDVGRTEKYGWYKQCTSLIILAFFFSVVFFDADRSRHCLYCMNEFRKEKQLF